MSDTAETVYEFSKLRATVRASIGTFRGRPYVSIREYYQPEPGAGLRPTKAGINVAVEDLPQLRACVDALEAAAQGGHAECQAP